MMMKNLFAAIITATLAVACLAVATGCSDNSAEHIKSALTKEFEGVESNEYTSNEPFSIVRFDCTNSSTDTYNVTATIENNTCKADVVATATKSNSDKSDTYSIDSKQVTITEVEGVNRVPESLESFAPDYDNQTVRYEDEEWLTDLEFSDPPFFLSEVSFPLCFNTSTFLWIPDTREASFKLSDDLNGTYTFPGNNATMTISNAANNPTICIDNPEAKRVNYRSFPAGSATMNDLKTHVSALDASDGEFYLSLYSKKGESNTVENTIVPNMPTHTLSWRPSMDIAYYLDGTMNVKLAIVEDSSENYISSKDYPILDLTETTYTKQ